MNGKLNECKIKVAPLRYTYPAFINLTTLIVQFCK